jgi:hypothetical protein
MHRTSFGDTVVHQKDAFHSRIFFQNIKGLTASPSCEDFKYSLASLSDLQTDIVSLSETNLPWEQTPHIQADFRSCLRRQFTTGKVVFGSPNSTVDPIQPNDSFQAGGSLIFTVGALVPMLSSSATVPLHDPTGMGRWCGTTIRGRGGSCLSKCDYRIQSMSWIHHDRSSWQFLSSQIHILARVGLRFQSESTCSHSNLSHKPHSRFKTSRPFCDTDA